MSNERYTIERYDNRADWLRARHNGLGASDSASVVGLSGWQSAYGLWVEKTEPIQIDSMDDLQRWGLLLEPVILQEFNRVGPIKAQPVEPFTIYRSKERPHLFTTLDAEGEVDGEPVQLKTAHFGAAKIWKREVPLSYMCQMQHEMYVTGAECAFIAVLADGYQFQWHRVPRHQRFIDKLLKKLDHFWFEHVQKRTPPPVDYHKATTQALLKKYPASNPKVIELPDEWEPLYDEFERVSKESKDAEKRKDEISNAVRERIGDATYGRFLSGKGWKWNGENGKRRLTKCPKCPDPTGNN